MKESDMEFPKLVREKAEAAKKYIEKKYNLNQIKAEQKTQNWRLFQEKLKQMQLSSTQQQTIKKQVIHEQMQQLRRKRQKISRMCFQSIAVIGRGAFGEVRLCRELKNGRIVAIKCLKKKQMIKKNQQTHLRDQRNILVDGSDWIVKLLYSFQDQTYLYLVMQFLAGGDLMTLLIQRNVISQTQARFYAAQAIMAIDSIHKMGYIHRDLKPDNILIDSTGHIKLSDFGLCKQAQLPKDDFLYQDMNKCMKLDFKNLGTTSSKYNNMINFKKKDRKLAYSAVGTPDYIAPEMLSRKGYTETVDWWSIGIMIFEMLVGYAPFSAQTNQEIYYKIQHHEKYLCFPPEIELSSDVIDLVSRLVTDDSRRLGNKGVSQIQKHRWFRNINWTDLMKMKPPFVPDLKNQTDVRYFDKYEQKEPWIYNPNDENYKKDFNFIGYTYKQQQSNQKQANQIYTKALVKAENEKKEQIQKQREWLDMLKTNMKKKKLNAVNQSKIFITKKTDKSTISNLNKSQLNTDRSRQNVRSKSPLADKDINIVKKRQSKSPLEPQKSTSYLRKPAYPSTLFQQTQPIPRKSLNTRR